jgi:hypothetical protein
MAMRPCLRRRHRARAGRWDARASQAQNWPLLRRSWRTRPHAPASGSRGTGDTRRAIEIVTSTGHWYRIGEDLVEVRWVYVHDGTGTHRDAYFWTTALTMKPHPMVECDTQRWSIATTFQACREYLKLESTTGDGQHTVLRFTPCVFGL